MSHYENDCLTIVESALDNVDILKNVGSLVLLSIRQPFFLMPQQMADVWEKGRDSKYLFGNKRAGYDFIQQNATRLQQAALRAYKADDLHGYIMTLLEVPNFGIVKASFFAQMTIGNGACMDLHNLQRMGLTPTAFAFPKALKPDSVHKRIRAYNAVWTAEGDSAYWWDTWCDHVATQSRNKFTSGAQVSGFHRLALGEMVDHV